MSRYDDLRDHEPFAKLVAHSATELAQLRAEYPGIPDDYLEFLREVGTGEIGSASFSLYGGLVPPEDIYDPIGATDVRAILLLGDDFQGYCVGFDTEHDWVVVEVEPSDRSLDVLAPSFETFVRQTLVEYGCDGSR